MRHKVIVKHAETMTPSENGKDLSSAKNAEDCDHDWEELGTLIYYEKGAPKMPGLNGCYSGHIKTDKGISVLKCKKCREVILKWNPWKRILEGEKDE